MVNTLQNNVICVPENSVTVWVIRQSRSRDSPPTRRIRVDHGIAQHARTWHARQARLSGRTDHIPDQLSRAAQACASTSCNAVAIRFQASTQPPTRPMDMLARFSTSQRVDSGVMLRTQPISGPQPLARTQRSCRRRRFMQRTTPCSHEEHTAVSVGWVE